MCGIAGFIRFSAAAEVPAVATMTDALQARGPDDRGVFLEPDGVVGLGHRRLAILDLSSAGRQPLSNRAGTVWITFNGEIYNFRELREELADGEPFRTQTDTEVILRAYERWGIECVRRLRGMFAFALWDSGTRKLFLVRDRMGVKPLYYHLGDGRLLFASELKAFTALPEFPRKLNPEAAYAYFRYGYVPSGAAIFQSTFKVRAGHYIEIAESGRQTETPYWSLESQYRMPPEKEEDTLESLREVATKSFAYRLVADVPVGLFLSGGVDSTLVAGLLAGRELKSFTVEFQSPDPDSARASEIARYLGMPHETLHCGESDALDLVPSLPTIYDEPLADPSTVPTTLLCRAARGHVKVALSGDGGDEFFCGYNTYPKFDTLWGNIARLPVPIRRLLGRATERAWPSWARALVGVSARRMLGSFDTSDIPEKLSKLSGVLKAAEFATAYRWASELWHGEEIPKLAPALRDAAPAEAVPEPLRGSRLEAMMLTDASTLLPDALLTKVDRASMSCGLEVREPLLDHGLIEFALSMPIGLKLNKGKTKYALKRLLSSIFPEKLLERQKRGFSPPLGRWLRGPLRGLLQDTLSTKRLRETGFISPEFAQNSVDAFLDGRAHSPRKIWSVLVFALWSERWAVS